MRYQLIALVIGLLSFSANASAETHPVKSADGVESLIKSGRLAPGDTIIWADGVSKDAELNLEGIDGTAEQPITLRAATPGGVILRGESQFRIGVQWWVIEGFHFDGDESGINAYNPIQLRGNGSTPAQHVRLTRCAMTNLRTDEETSKWVLIYGRFNTIDHCHFSGKDSKGALITVELGDLPADATAEHRIERNYFGDIAPHEGTDNETIRIGFSGDQNKAGKIVVRQNLFVRCNGENEIISNKSSFNIFEANTFRQCDGALVLRHGHHARVEGNFFFGDGAENAGGIRVSDSHHVIENNYLQDLTGTSWNAAFSILGGKEPSGGSGNGYQAVDEITVAHNTILNCRQSLLLNSEKGSRAPTGAISNNLVSSSSGPLIEGKLPTDRLTWTGNLLHGAPIGAEIEATTVDPQLREVNGLLRPDPSGPAAKLGAKGDITTPPLTAADVGVAYLRGEGPKNR